jgi:methionine-rich copper-binding protein CopC
MTGSREASAPRIALIIAALALLLAALSLGGGQRAFAHADYESSTPADGETVSESPERVDVVFGQEAARQGGLPTLIVVNQFGDLIADEAVLDDVDRTHMSVALPPALGSGRYTVIWHTVSDEDGEEAQGAFHFYVGAGPSATTQATAGPDATPQTAAPTVVNGGTGDGGGEGSDVPLWALIGGVVVSLMAGSGAGVALAARRPD